MDDIVFVFVVLMELRICVDSVEKKKNVQYACVFIIQTERIYDRKWRINLVAKSKKLKYADCQNVL